MPTCGWRVRISCAPRRPSSVWVGGMRMSTIATSGGWLDRQRAARSTVPTCATTSTPASRSSAASPSRTISMSSAITTRTGTPPSASSRRRPGSDLQRSVERLHAVGEAAQARAVRRVRAAAPVVGDLHARRAPLRETRSVTAVARACLATLVSASDTRK